MITLFISLVLSFSYATPAGNNCSEENSIQIEGSCYLPVDEAECSVDPTNIKLNNFCYKPVLTTQNQCSSDFSLNINNEFCVDTSTFSDLNSELLYQKSPEYQIEVKIIPKNMTSGFEQQNENTWYLDRLFNTFKYEDNFNPFNKVQYSFSAPMGVSENDFELYDKKIIPEIFSSIEQSLVLEQSSRFKMNNQPTPLIENSKLDLARTLESVFTKYGDDLRNYDLYVGVLKSDQDSSNMLSYASVGLPMKNGQVQIKVFSSNPPLESSEELSKTESATGFELSLLNIHSGSFILDVYGNIYEVEQHSNEDFKQLSPEELNSMKGWALGTRLKPTENLDLSLEVGESKTKSEGENTLGISKKQDADMSLKLSISYVFSGN